MKKIALLLIAISTLLSCEKPEKENSSPYNGSISGGSIQQTACLDAVYPHWQDSRYVLPYPVGKSYLVTLNHCSSSYHREGEPDQFAVDFNMAVGREVVAARDGVVVFVEESGIDGHFPNNLVVIRHIDDSFAHYMHLTQNGAAVDVGDKVTQGTIVGYSGSTGLAGAPHLHFVVTAPGGYGYPYTSIPYNFRNTVENARGPEQGIIYEALPY